MYYLHAFIYLFICLKSVLKVLRLECFVFRYSLFHCQHIANDNILTMYYPLLIKSLGGREEASSICSFRFIFRVDLYPIFLNLCTNVYMNREIWQTKCRENHGVLSYGPFVTKKGHFKMTNFLAVN
jgi:hypothetical protein